MRSSEPPKAKPNTPAMKPPRLTETTSERSAGESVTKRGPAGVCGRFCEGSGVRTECSTAGTSSSIGSVATKPFSSGTAARRALRSGESRTGSELAGSTRLRPWSFARYTARSAWWMISLGSAPSSG
jgi:hypothetical protein